MPQEQSPQQPENRQGTGSETGSTLEEKAVRSEPKGKQARVSRGRNGVSDATRGEAKSGRDGNLKYSSPEDGIVGGESQMNKFAKKARKGFTLVEIMIVVLIIGILLAIAVPNFIKARESSRTKACVANLRQIDSAKEQWAMDNKKDSSDTPVEADLTGASGYIKTFPECPSGGTYTIGAISTNPSCSTAGEHVLN